MIRARKAHKAPNEQQGYPAWKASAAIELKERHRIEATAIAERIWVQFYVRGIDPREAADRAEIVYQGAQPPSAWLKKK
jgi:hypothetical protein